MQGADVCSTARLQRFLLRLSLRKLACSMGAMLLISANIRSACAQTLSVAQLAQRVDRHYNHLKSFAARYTERYQGMGTDRTESGTLLLRKPGRMRWSYDAPAGKVFLLNGKDAISYTPDDAQANRLPARQLDDLRSPLRFLLGRTELSKELDQIVLAPVQDGYTLTGIPKVMHERLRSVVLTVDADGMIHKLSLEEADGARTTFTFTNLHENPPAPDSAFVFTPPPGVTVVDGAAPI